MHGTDRTLRVVCCFDPALDLSKEELDEYVDKRPDASTLRLLPGTKATVYHVRPLSKAMMRHCDAALDSTERALRAFIAGVEKIENLVQDDGTVTPLLQPTLPVPLPGGAQVRFWRDEELELVSHWALVEIGGVAYSHSSFPPGIARHYLLLRSSPLVVEAVTRRLAGRILRDAPKSSETPEPERTKTPAESGGAPTAATATG